MSTTDRSDYIRGLRELADRLDANPDCPLPYHGNDVPLSVYAMNDAELRAAAKAIGGQKGSNEVAAFFLTRTLGGLTVKTTPLYGPCERVEVGTKKETREVEVCTRCYEELAAFDGGRACPNHSFSAPGGALHDYLPTPATKSVEVEVPVYETRCPESLLRPEAASIEDRVICFTKLPGGFCVLDKGHDEGCANVRTVVGA